MRQARYEAERAFAEYDQIDPGNRLVAEVLEQRWNAKLAERRLSHDVEETNPPSPYQGPLHTRLR